MDVKNNASYVSTRASNVTFQIESFTWVNSFSLFLNQFLSLFLSFFLPYCPCFFPPSFLCFLSFLSFISQSFFFIIFFFLFFFSFSFFFPLSHKNVASRGIFTRKTHLHAASSKYGSSKISQILCLFFRMIRTINLPMTSFSDSSG